MGPGWEGDVLKVWSSAWVLFPILLWSRHPIRAQATIMGTWSHMATNQDEAYMGNLAQLDYP
jgi:hypothetical protein